MEFHSIAWLPLPLILLISVLLYRNLRKNLKLPPGPTPLPIVGNLHMISTLPHRFLSDLAQKYGPIMTIYFGSVPTIVVSSPEMAKQVLKIHDHVFASRPTSGDDNPNKYESPSKVAFAQYGPYWKFMRKILIVELFSPKQLESFQSMRVKEVTAMTCKILVTAAANVNSSNPVAVDISKEVSVLTNNIICKMALGKACSEDQLCGKGFKEMLEEVIALAAGFSYEDAIPLLGWLDLGGVKKRQAEIHNVFYGFLDRVMDEHCERRSKGNGFMESKDFVDVLLSVSEDESMDIKITRKDIQDVIFDILDPGTDSPAITLEWAMSELLKNPSAMKRAQEELDSVLGQNRIVQESDLPYLKYLQSVVKETLRLHPPSPLLLPHESMEHFTIAGYQIPEKTRVFVNAWAIGRDPTAWSEANEFKPERFLGTQIDVKGQDFGVIPFGSGRRICPAISLGLCVIQLGLAQLLQCFKWDLPQGVTAENLDMCERFGVTTPRALHLQAIPTPRLPLHLYPGHRVRTMAEEEG